MKVLLDTNIVLDVLLKREPFFEDAQKVFVAAKWEDVDEYISASTITDIYYIAQRTMRDDAKTRTLIKNLLTVVHIATVSQTEIHYAIDLPWKDFEDSVQYSVALLNSMDGIITRDRKGYHSSELPVWSPATFFEFLKV